jgi:hypothetical protein
VFRAQNGRWPGTVNECLAQDEASTFEIMHNLCTNKYLLGDSIQSLAVQSEDDELPESVVVRRDHAVEVVRFGAMELHNVSAMIGGIAAQEAVKVITHQFVPLNNTYVYNGIASCGATYIL